MDRGCLLTSMVRFAPVVLSLAMSTGALLAVPCVAAAQRAVANLPPAPASLAADNDGRVRAQLSARNSVTLSSELAARIATLTLRDGDAFREGQVLVSFDCSLFDSQLQK